MCKALELHLTTLCYCSSVYPESRDAMYMLG